MIKILIAEDELPLLRGLKVLIEQISSKYKVVKCAKNGKEAIEYLKHHSVDLVFTDINMPLVDGLELMKFIHDQNIEVKKVVISGYDKFSYAKQAIQYGAKDYLLKPIVKEDLEKLLNNLSQEIEIERREIHEHLIQENISKGQSLSTQKNYFLINIGYENIIFQKRSIDIKKIMNNVETFIATITASIPDVFIIQNQRPQEQLIVMHGDNIEVREISECLHEFIKSESVHHTIVYGLKNISSENLYTEANRFSNFLQNQALVEDSLIVEINGNAPIIYKLNSHAYPNSIDSSYNLIIKRFEQVLEYSLTQKNLKELVYELFVYFIEEDKSTRFLEDQVVERLILEFPDKKELFEAILKENIIQKRLSEDPTTEELMIQLEQYISEHLHETLTVSFLAEKFGFVPPYLSSLFKEHSGDTLYQYIQNKRIEKAKKLIEQGNTMIKEVSKVVGYQDPLHFSKVFKSKVGQSPREYQLMALKMKRSNDDEI